MTKREKGLLLGGLLLIWGTLMFFEGLDQEDQQYQAQTVSGKNSSNLGKHRNRPQTFGAGNPLQTIALNKPRNIFAPLRDPNQPKPKPKIAKKTAAPPKVKASRPTLPKRPPVQPKRTGPSPSDLATQQAQQEMKKYQFLGYLTQKGEQQIFLSNGQAIYIVKQGETLEGDIQVKSIEPTSVVLSKQLKGLGETVEATLPLTKNKT